MSTQGKDCNRAKGTDYKSAPAEDWGLINRKGRKELSDNSMLCALCTCFVFFAVK
jgi:hypothetical protein